jgi:cytochrome c oxidase subunit IV
MPDPTFEEELSAEGMPDPRESGAPHSNHPSAKEYLRIGLVLAVLTALEVAASYRLVDNTGLMITVLTFLSVVKFSLVVMYFMHLKFDDRRYARFFVMGFALAFTLFLIVLLLSKVYLR